MFTLHPTLDADTFTIGDFKLCVALLMNQSALPWVILVPKRAGIREMYELGRADQEQALTESMQVGASLMHEFRGDKLNTAALGNMVPQLHLHHIVRYQHDTAWPNPAWGNLPDKAYTQITSQQMLNRLRRLFKESCDEFVEASS